MGPIATGLGDIFQWTIEMREIDQIRHKDGEPSVLRDGSYITPEGEQLTSEVAKAMVCAARRSSRLSSTRCCCSSR